MNSTNNNNYVRRTSEKSSADTVSPTSRGTYYGSIKSNRTSGGGVSQHIDS